MRTIKNNRTKRNNKNAFIDKNALEYSTDLC